MRILNSAEDINRFIKNNKICLLYFSAENCQVCSDLLPKIELLIKNYSKIKSAEVGIDKLPSLVGKYSIFTFPCILIFIEGREIIREARFVSVIELEKKIERFYDLIQ
jgi:thioredoxin-like negative regulator of GroEL